MFHFNRGGRTQEFFLVLWLPELFIDMLLVPSSRQQLTPATFAFKITLYGKFLSFFHASVKI